MTAPSAHAGREVVNLLLDGGRLAVAGCIQKLHAGAGAVKRKQGRPNDHRPAWGVSHQGAGAAVAQRAGAVVETARLGGGKPDGGGAAHAGTRSMTAPGTISSSDTSPLVKASTARMLSSGTPFFFHCEMAAGDTPKWAAIEAERPLWASSQVVMFMAGSLEPSKPNGQVKSKPLTFSISLAMDQDRRRRFIAWFSKTYAGMTSAEARAKFVMDAKRFGDKAITKGRVSQLFDEQQQFGERAAKNIAIRLGLRADYFLMDAAAAGAPPTVRTAQAEALATLFDRITDPEEQNRFRVVAAHYAELAIRGELIATLEAMAKSWPGPAPNPEPQPADVSQSGSGRAAQI